MRQVAGNLFGNCFRIRRIMFLGILHSLYFYYSSLFYHRLLLKSYSESISITTRPLLTSTAFAYKTNSTATAHILCNLPSIHLYIISFSIYWLVENDFPVLECASEADQDPPKFFTSDRFPPSHALTRSELR